VSASHPRYLWWNGKRVAWEGATVHVTQLGWATVPAIFEGIMSYWNDAEEELFVFRLDAHLQRFLRSQKMMRMARDYSVAQLTEVLDEGELLVPRIRRHRRVTLSVAPIRIGRTPP